MIYDGPRWAVQPLHDPSMFLYSVETQLTHIGLRCFSTNWKSFSVNSILLYLQYTEVSLTPHPHYNVNPSIQCYPSHGTRGEAGIGITRVFRAVGTLTHACYSNPLQNFDCIGFTASIYSRKTTVRILPLFIIKKKKSGISRRHKDSFVCANCPYSLSG